jgi:hypothetical protein
VRSRVNTADSVRMQYIVHQTRKWCHVFLCIHVCLKKNSIL